MFLLIHKIRLLESVAVFCCCCYTTLINRHSNRSFFFTWKKHKELAPFILFHFIANGKYLRHAILWMVLHQSKCWPKCQPIGWHSHGFFGVYAAHIFAMLLHHTVSCVRSIKFTKRIFRFLIKYHVSRFEQI